MRNRLWASRAATIALLVVACASPQNVSPSASGGPGGTPSAQTPGTQPTGGTVTVNAYQKWTRLSPFLTGGGDKLTMQLNNEALVQISADASVFSRLADIESSPDATKFTFHLHDGLTWSDGQPFTSKDILLSYRAYSNPISGSIYSGAHDSVVGMDEFRAGTVDTPSGYSAPDDRTFSIELTTPNAAFLARLSNPIQYMLPAHILGQKPLEGLSEDPYWDSPTVGLGPYRFVRNEVDQFLEFEKNENYHSPVALDTVFVKNLAADIAAASLEAGELDLVQVGVDDASRLGSMSGVEIAKRAGIQPIYIVPNLDNPLFADKRVRQALLHAIDRQGIVATVLGGQADVPLTYPFGPDWAIATDLPTYDYDPERAKQLLTDAGFDFGKEVTLDLVPGPKDRERVLEVVASQLQAVGINVKVRLLEVGPYLEARKDGSFMLSMSGGEIGTIDPDISFVAFKCNGYYKDGNGTNFANYCDPNVDELFAKGRATTIQSERATYYQEATKILADDMPYLLLYRPTTLYATTTRLQGFDPNGDFTLAFWNAGEWSVKEQ